MTKTPLLKWMLLVAIVVIQTQAFALTAFGQSSGFTITPIVKRGDPVGDGGRFFDCGDCVGRVVGVHPFNNRGHVAILAEVVSGTCFTNRFLISGPESIRLADFCHTTEFGRLTFLGSVNINDSGQAALNAGITIDNRIVEMLLLYSDGQTTKIVQEGDRTPTGTLFKGCGFGQPAINNKGDVAFFACSETDDGSNGGDRVSVYSGGEIRKVVVSNDPSPIGGTFALNFIPAQAVQMNDRGDVLFQAGVILDPFKKEKFGLFVSTEAGIKKIEVDGDALPGGAIKENTFGSGDINNLGDVTFSVNLTGVEADSGIFLCSGGQTKKVMAAGDPTPVGGKFASLVDPELREDFPTPRINDNGTIAFKVRVAGGVAPSAIFLASTSAIVKVVAAGDQLPTGETIRVIDTFALNDLGQVAFFAYGKKDKTNPLGVYVATPVAPTIGKIKLKRKSSGLELRVNGSAMITNDTVIEINGIPLSAVDYPSDFHEDGGFTTRVVSRDSRLEQLIPEGQPVQITVSNSLTKLRSAPLRFTR